MCDESSGERGAAQVWLAIWITLAFSAVAFFLHLQDALKYLLRPYTRLPLAEWLLLAFLFWLLTLLWLAYRNWHADMVREEIASASLRPPDSSSR
jgi:hypothetical protein